MTEEADAQNDHMLLLQKTPAAFHAEWDTRGVLSVLPANGLYVLLGQGGCKLIRN